MAERLPSELSWRRALETRRSVVAGQTGLSAASRVMPRVGRRRFLVAALAGAFATSVAAGVGGLVSFLYPLGVTKSGGPIPAGNVTDYPVGGSPVLNSSAGFFLVNLDPADAAPNGSGGGQGLLALARKCPHLGCAVPWNAGFVFEDEQGWFRCPCHQSTYTKAGIRVFGPAPRPMDTMRVEIGADGTITVHSDEITRGSETNPARAVLPT